MRILVAAMRRRKTSTLSPMPKLWALPSLQSYLFMPAPPGLKTRSMNAYLSFAFRGQRINSSPTPTRCQLSFPLAALPPSLCPELGPTAMFQKCHLTWAPDSEALKQSDVGFPSHVRLSAGIWADTRTDSSN